MLQKIVLAGGSGYLGSVLAQYFADKVKEVVILSRTHRQSIGHIRFVQWNARTKGNWVNELEDADALINLCGKNVNCRYTAKARTEILRSRLVPTQLLDKALRDLVHPPKVWIQAASATIYRHAEDRQQTEKGGEFGEGFSVDVCQAWESAFNEIAMPNTRKVVLRVAIVLGKKDGVYPRLRNLISFGLGGHQGKGTQRVSWIHELDFARATEWMIRNDRAEGVYNLAAVEAPTNKSFMTTLRKQHKQPLGLPSPSWLLEVGAWLIGTETELILKSRWVYPERLLAEEFGFCYPKLAEAAEALVAT